MKLIFLNVYDECFWNFVIATKMGGVNLKLSFTFTMTIWEEIFYLNLLLEMNIDVCMMATYDVICCKLTNFLCGLFKFHCSPDIWLVRVLEAEDACWLLPPIERVAPRTWSIGMECISSSANWSARCNWISIQQGVSCKYHDDNDVKLVIG